MLPSGYYQPCKRGSFIPVMDIEEEGNTLINITDPSITNNPKVKCVFDNLTQHASLNGLNQILNFGTNKNINITFKVVNGLTNSNGQPVDANTSGSNGNYLIQLNGDNANDDDYHRIWLAATIIHESFHARILAMAFDAFGTDEQNPAAWPSQINNPTLQEIRDYFTYNETNNLSKPFGLAQHDWMVMHLNDLAISLREFVKNNYQQTYAKAGDDLDVYKSFILAIDGSLAKSRFYDSAVSDLGGEEKIENSSTFFNDGGECNN